MVERAQNNPKIKWELNQEVSELLTEKQGIMNNDTLVAVKTKNTQTGEEERGIPFQGLFVAIGHSPTTSLFQDYPFL